jgi:hypothetical protein
MMNALSNTMTKMGRTVGPAARRQFSTQKPQWQSQTARRQFSAQNSEWQSQNPGEALKKDPRTIPRVAVLAVAVSFVGIMASREGQKAKAQIQDKNEEIKEHAPPNNIEAVRKAKDASKAFNNTEKERYEKLPYKGLGVSDSEQKTANPDKQ